MTLTDFNINRPFRIGDFFEPVNNIVKNLTYLLEKLLQPTMAVRVYAANRIVGGIRIPV